MAGRYVPTRTPDQKKWVILDLDLPGYCTIPDKDDPSSLIPLEWDSRASAQAWLHKCYRHWAMWEVSPKRREDVPLRWRPIRRVA